MTAASHVECPFGCAPGTPEHRRAHSLSLAPAGPGSAESVSPLSRARSYSRNIGLRVTRGEGARVLADDGRWYFDFLAGAGSLSLGHGHPVVTEAITRALSEGAPLQSLDLSTPWLEDFLAELFLTLPPGLARDGVVHLCAPSGANAVEAALAAAEVSRGSSEHLAFRGGFHGSTLGARQVTSRRDLRASTSAGGGNVHFLPYPQSFRSPHGVGTDVSADQALAELSDLLSAPDSVVSAPASMILEFVLGEGGVIPADRRWARGLRELATRHGVVLIADEIQAGVGRTGRMWSFEHVDVEPDMLVASKGLGGGMPIAVMVTRPEFDTWNPGYFTGTFRGSSLAFAAAAATLRFIRETDLPSRAAELGGRMLMELQEIAAGHDALADVRGIGLMLGIEVVDPSGPLDVLTGAPAPDPGLTRQLQAAALGEGLIAEVGGIHDNVLRLLPPLTTTDDEAAQALAALRRAVARLPLPVPTGPANNLTDVWS